MPQPLLFDPGPAVAEPTNRTLSCVSCGLFRDVRTPRMKPWGNFRRRFMICGQGPGAQEDKHGRPFKGKTGSLLTRTLKELGIDLEDDCLSTNAVHCFPPDDRMPTPHELACCRTKYLYPEIETHKPKVVLLLGGAATASVLGTLNPEINDGITKWRGHCVPVQRWNAWVCPTFHPSFVAREDRPEVDTIWRRDLRVAIDLLDEPAPKLPNLRERVTILRGEDEILAELARARRSEYFSHDYETTGLRPAAGHIVCASFATDEGRAFAFTWRGPGPVADAWAAVLEDDGVGKISHNMKFEDNWSRHHLGIKNIRWVHDSMIAAHVLDNRVGLCGLKLQLFLSFGLEPYDAAISPYLESVDRGDPNSQNRIVEFIERYGEDECLVYCGIDSLGAHRLAMKQMREMGRE